MIIQKEEILGKKISCCLGCKTITTSLTTVKEALDEIKNGNFSRNIIALRNSNFKEHREKKKKLKAYIFGGTFLNRKESIPQSYSCLCILDFDHVGDVEKAKKELYANDYVFSAWTSPSGDGVKAIIVFDYSVYTDIKDIDCSELHKKAYKQFKENNLFSFKLDESGKDVCRLCFTSFDSNLWIKNSVQGFPVKKVEIEKSEKKSRLEKKREKKSVKKWKNKNNELISLDKAVYQKKDNVRRHEMKSICKYLCKRNLSITSTYQEWYRIGQAIANVFSSNIGLKYYLRLCRLDGEMHDEKASISKLNECYAQIRKKDEHKYGIKTIIEAAQKKGWNNGRGEKSSL